MKIFSYLFIFVCVLNLALPYLCEGNDSIVVGLNDLTTDNNFDLFTRDKSVNLKGSKKKKYNRRVLGHGFMMRKRGSDKERDDADFSIDDGDDQELDSRKEVTVPAQVYLLIKWLRYCNQNQQRPITFVLNEPDNTDYGLRKHTR